MVAAAWEEDSGYADPYLTVNAYAAAAKRAGARLLTNTAVTGITRHGDRVTGVRTTAGDLSAPVVVNCAGPWAGLVGAMAGVELPVTPLRRQIVVTEPLPPTLRALVPPTMPMMAPNGSKPLLKLCTSLRRDDSQAAA